MLQTVAGPALSHLSEPHARVGRSQRAARPPHERNPMPFAELRIALRALARTPIVTLSAIACLALGIGATTAIASAVSRALLATLPYRDPATLVAVHRITPQSGPMGTWPSSAANYADLARDT